jgi:hypothetical protein
MIRSGSTLQYNLVRGLVESVGKGKGEGYVPPHWSLELRDQLFRWAEDSDYHVIKSHALPLNARDMVEADTARICYIYRDIRDVAASAKAKWGHRGDRLYAVLEEAIREYYATTALPAILMQKYEGVVTAIPSALTEVSDYLRIRTDCSTRTTIANENSLQSVKRHCESLQQKRALTISSTLMNFARRTGVTRWLSRSPIPQVWLQRLRDWAGQWDRRTLRHRDHISKHNGSSGIWREELSSEEIEEITERFADWLRETQAEEFVVTGLEAA